ncbi:MAG: hypothetical protein KAU16_05085, partial [Methanophagales archaeon]|nr:hypothetical protein [Methanophagales archaeon]
SKKHQTAGENMLFLLSGLITKRVAKRYRSQDYRKPELSFGKAFLLYFMFKLADELLKGSKLTDELALKLGDELKERVAKRHGL